MSIEERIFYTDWEINWSKKVLVYFKQRDNKPTVESMDTIVDDQKRLLAILEKEKELLVEERRLHEYK